MEQTLEKRDIIAVDFDGTLCENQWPEIGLPNTKLIKELIYRRKQGDKLILWTNRVDDKLENAVNWCKEQGLEFDAINDNLPEIVESFGSNSRKVFANIYIDDRANNRYDLPFAAEREGMMGWAEREVDIACKPYVVFCEDFLFEGKGDFDTFGILYLRDPKGNTVPINRFFKEAEEDGLIEISKEEYESRRPKKEE